MFCKIKKFFMSLTVMACLGVLLQGCGNKARLEKSAKPIVTKMVKGIYPNMECVQIEIGDKIADNLYDATAILTDGSKLPITIYDKGKEILVTLKRER